MHPGETARKFRVVRHPRGLNTALECLTQGVPMVAIPITNDQPGVAARIAEKKTGLVVALNDLTASRLSPSRLIRCSMTPPIATRRAISRK
jgi:UDP:flavonoid glycosyltransferase YjiC (YdhE family)